MPVRSSDNAEMAPYWLALLFTAAVLIVGLGCVATWLMYTAAEGGNDTWWRRWQAPRSKVKGGAFVAARAASRTEHRSALAAAAKVPVDDSVQYREMTAFFAQRSSAWFAQHPHAASLPEGFGQGLVDGWEMWWIEVPSILKQDRD